MKHKIKVVMLPTEKASHIGICIKEMSDVKIGELKSFASSMLMSLEYWKPQHIHITVALDVEPIKEGDWCIYLMQDANDSMDRTHVFQAGVIGNCNSKKTINNTDKTFYFEYECRKIIGTNDPKLFTRTSFLEDISNNTVSLKCNLPQLQQSSLEEFVANPDGEWEVEYNDTCDVERGQCCCSERDVDCELHSLKLKLNQDNTVNIISVNNRSNKIKSIAEELRALTSAKAMIPLDNWIKENL